MSWGWFIFATAGMESKLAVDVLPEPAAFSVPGGLRSLASPRFNPRPNHHRRMTLRGATKSCSGPQNRLD